jgi:hypothetical protein
MDKFVEEQLFEAPDDGQPEYSQPASEDTNPVKMCDWRMVDSRLHPSSTCCYGFCKWLPPSGTSKGGMENISFCKGTYC